MKMLNPTTDVLARIDAGEFDSSSPSTVLRMLVNYAREPDSTNDRRFYREMVTQMWVINQCEKNGEPVFAVDGLPCVLPLLPGTVRSALVAGLEFAITERYGSAHAEGEILRFYTLMLDAGQGVALTLSPFGVEVLTDIFLCILRDAVSDGSTVVVH